jgi:hypothetical protein
LQSSRGLPSGGGQQARQLFARPVNVASSGDLRNAENLSDFLEREPFFISQYDRLALVGPERGHGVLERASQCLLLDGIRHRGSRRFRCLRGTAARPGIGGNDPNAPAPHGIDADVVRDAENPRRQPSRRVECCEVAKGFDECLLSEIFCEGCIAGQSDEQRYNRTLVPAHNLFERRLRAAERLRYEPRLGDTIDIDPDEPPLAIRSYERLRQDARWRCRTAGLWSITPGAAPREDPREWPTAPAGSTRPVRLPLMRTRR